MFSVYQIYPEDGSYNLDLRTYHTEEDKLPESSHQGAGMGATEITSYA